MRSTRTSHLRRTLAGVFMIAVVPAGCDRLRPDRRDLTLPPIEEITRIYRENGLEGAIAYDGNVVQIRVRQPATQLQRGGSLWARVGPYIYLFNPGTRTVFDAYPGVAAVRAVTLNSGGREVARATLLAAELNDVLWRRTLNILGHAVNEGTRRPSLLLDLVRWGEEHTSFRYNPQYVPEGTSGTSGAESP